MWCAASFSLSMEVEMHFLFRDIIILVLHKPIQIVVTNNFLKLSINCQFYKVIPLFKILNYYFFFKGNFSLRLRETAGPVWSKVKKNVPTNKALLEILCACRGNTFAVNNMFCLLVSIGFDLYRHNGTISGRSVHNHC